VSRRVDPSAIGRSDCPLPLAGESQPGRLRQQRGHEVAVGEAAVGRHAANLSVASLSFAAKVFVAGSDTGLLAASGVTESTAATTDAASARAEADTARVGRRRTSRLSVEVVIVEILSTGSARRFLFHSLRGGGVLPSRRRTSGRVRHEWERGTTLTTLTPILKDRVFMVSTAE